jgi:hypothetical protein
MATTDSKGFWQNKSGGFVHKDLVNIDKQLEDEVVEKLIGEAHNMQQQLLEFKYKAFEDCYNFNDLLRDEYNLKKIKSTSGAVTFRNFNGTQEVTIQVAKLITFDQKLTLAKEKIDIYLDNLTKDSESEIRTLITNVFDVKNGKVDAKKILSLKSYNISNPLWQEAMKMIDDAIEVAGTKSYIRFKEKASIDSKLESISLDIASLDIAKYKKEITSEDK